MSTKDPNMKVIFGSDTKDFEKGANAVKQGLKDLDKSSSSMLSSISNAFGVNTQKVEQMTSAVRGLGYKLVETGNSGAKALGSILAKIGPLTAGIAGLGIGAAVAGFRQLKEEADNFKSTIDGMNMSMATSAYISTYKQVLHDVNSDTGKAVAEAMDKWERGFGRFRANLGAALTVGMSDSKWYDAFLPTGLIRGYKAVNDAAAEANTQAEKAAKLGAEQAEQMKEQLALDYEIKLMDRDIAELRRQASDKTASTAEREAARVEYLNKVNEKYDKQADLASRMYATQEALDDLASNTFEDTRKTLEMKGRILEIDTNRQNELKALDKLGASIASSASSEAASRKKAREEVQQMLDYMARRTELNMSQQETFSNLPTLQGMAIAPMSLSQKTIDEFKERLQLELGETTLYVGIRAQKDSVVDLTNEINSMLESSFMRTGEIMGNLIGTLASGGDAWGDFKNAAVSALGDMAIAIGKIAIKSGVAMLGIQAALKMDNPYVAIAAGAALVALGAAVKSSLSAVASGDYSAGGGGYSSGYSGGSGGGNYETRDVVVNVSGTLQADGNQLIAVINNTNKKNYYTQ